MKKFSRRFIIYIIIFSIYISQMEFVQYISNDLLRDAIIMAIKYVPVIYIGLLVTATVCKYNASNSNLSEKGIKEASQWSALYKYIDRYLTVNETNSRGIKVYEKILVYATVFGISQKMINNLQIIHPEIFAKDDKITTYKYWNFVCTNIDGKNSFNIIRDELEKVCNKIIEINNNIGYSDKK